jgi:hypothetical protein
MLYCVAWISLLMFWSNALPASSGWKRKLEHGGSNVVRDRSRAKALSKPVGVRTLKESEALQWEGS